MKTNYTCPSSHSIKTDKQPKTTILPLINTTAFAKWCRSLFILFFALAAINAEAQTCPSGSIIYVDSSKVSASIHDGSSWDKAFTTLQDALTITKNCTTAKQIWVAKGTYYPSAAFQLKNNLAIYGGFAGNEAVSYNISQRNFLINGAILNGRGQTIVADGSGTDNTAVLDGFTITKGYGGSYGGGMYNETGSPTIRNCIFLDNSVNAYGAGMYNENSNPVIINCSFSGNSTTNGGGMYNENSSPTITNCTFSYNKANIGGGIYNEDNSNPDINNCIFISNSTTSAGGGICNSGSAPTITNCVFSGNAAIAYGGGICNTYSSNSFITNCLFSGNSAIYGGGIINRYNSSPDIKNCTITGNSANGEGGGGIENDDNSNPVITNCIVWNNERYATVPEVSATGTAEASISSAAAPTIYYSLVQNITLVNDGNNNLDGITNAGDTNYPRFIIPLNPMLAPSTGGDFHLQYLSPAIDSGSNAANTLATDLDAKTRIVNNIIDLGAYENQVGGCPQGNIVYVDSSNTSNTHNGASWATAFTTLQDALAVTRSCTGGKQIWVAKGTYYPDKGGVQNSGDVNATFQLKNNLAIYGGFSSTDTSLSQRNYAANVTILSGDINKSKSLNTGDAAHVVSASGINSTAVLDGFTITGGYITGTTGNVAGAGMYNISGSPVIANCIFSGNSTGSGAGGGMYNTFNSTPVITNCTFSGNYASQGGGMNNYFNSSPVISNCTFSGNAAGSGGGMFNNQNSSPAITNCIIWNNKDNTGTGTANASIYNNGSSPAITYSLVQNTTAPDGNHNLDGKTNASDPNYPLFITMADPTTAPSTNGNLRLQCFSPAIDSGNNVTDTFATDLDNQARIFGGVIDLGAYEKQVACCPPNNIVYVDSSATGMKDGSSWTNAFTTLQDALVIAAHCSKVNQVWVAKGTYYPDEGGRQTDNNIYTTFHLINKVAVYGGFNGKEANLASRDFKSNITILSGDINGNHKSDAGDTYRLITGSGTDSTAMLDGFTIGSNFIANNTHGGGLYNSSGSPTVNNCIFYGNYAGNFNAFGGAMCNEFNSNPIVTNCLFSGNSTYDGNDMYNYNNSSPIVTNCVFSGNSSGSNAVGSGGAMYNEHNSSPVITNCTFSGNSAGSNGEGGSMFNYDNSNPIITNCIFSGNLAKIGGGIYNALYSSPVITNCTFSGNSADGGCMFNSYNSSPIILTNCIFWNNNGGSIYSSEASITITHSLVQGITTTDGNHNLDGITHASDSNYPLFVTPVDPSTAPTIAGDFHLRCLSPAIDKGNNDSNKIATDLDGKTRIVNGVIDLGAYENQGGCTQTTTTAIATSGSPSCQGSSVTFTATITSNSNPVTTGGVTFSQGSTVLADSIVLDANGHAAFATDTLGAGSHTIIATYKPASSAFGTSNGSVMQTVNALPVVSFSGLSASSYCSNAGAVTLTGSPAGGMFSRPGITGNSFNPATAGTGLVTITYTYTNSSTGCTNAGKQVITVNAAPTVTPIIYSANNPVCSGSMASLTDATPGGVWSSSNTSVATVNSSGTVTFGTVSASAQVTIYYRITNSSSCSAQSSIVFTVNPPLSVKPITGTVTICGIGSSTQLTDATAGGTWSSSNMAVATVSTTGLVTGKAIGSATIYYMVSSGGCTASVSTPVSVNTAPAVAAITGSSQLIKGCSIQLKDATTGGTWSSSNTNVATVSAAGVVKGIMAGNCTIYYTVKSGSCSAVASKAVTVYNPLTATVSIGKILCYGGTATITVNASGGSGGYKYSLNGSKYQTGNIFTVTAGLYILIITDQMTNQVTLGGIIVLQPAPVTAKLVSGTNASSKTTANGSFTVKGSGGTSLYQYSKNSGASYQSSATFSGLAAGSYKVSVKDANNCVSLNCLTVTVGYGKSYSAIAATLPGDDATITASVYPNPSTSSFNLQLKSSKDETVEIRVTDILGHTLYQTKGNATGSFRFGEHFTAGMYVIEVIYKGGIKTLKVVKQ